MWCNTLIVFPLLILYITADAINNPMKYILSFGLVVLFCEVSSAQKGDYVFTMEMMNSTPVMTVTSIKTFACSNYGIYIRQGWSRDTLTLNILGIDSRQNCNNVADHAREMIQISGIRETEFVLRFRHESKYNFFRVKFDGESFSISPEQSDFIRAVTY